MHNCTAHPAAAEPVIQFPVGPDDLLDRVNVGFPDPAAARSLKGLLAQG